MALHPWETPRTSYTIQDGVTADDFNRIGNNISYIYQTTGPFGISSNNGNAYTVSIPDIVSYEDRLMIKVYVSATNTGSCTINLNNLGNKTVLKSNNDPTSKGDFRQGDIVSLLYYSNHFRIINSVNSEVPYGATTGNGTNYTANVTHVGALHPGTEITLKFHSANLGPSTLNVNGLGAHAIKIRTNEDTLQGYIQANQVSKLVYDGTYWQLQNTIATSLVNSIGQKNLIHIADTTNKVDDTHYNLVVPLLTSLQNGMVIQSTLPDIPKDNIFLNINSKGNKELILSDSLRLNSDFLHDKEIYFYYNSAKDKFVLIPNGNIIESLNNKIESQNILTYNFKNKVAGSIVEVPMKIYRNVQSTTPNPTVEGNPLQGWDDYYDKDQDFINNLKYLDGNVALSSSSSHDGQHVSGRIMKFMIEVDLNPLCNGAFGGSHEALKNAMKGISFNIWASGSGDNGGSVGHNVNFKLWDKTQNRWDDYGTQNSTNSIKLLNRHFEKNEILIHDFVISNNKIYVLISSGYPSSATIPSTLNLDYFELKLELKPSWELDENLRKSLQTNIDTNKNNISSNLGKINTNASNINSNLGKINTNKNNIADNLGKINTNQANIAAMLTRLGATEQEIHDILNPEQSLGGAGHKKLTGGGIIQWGSTSTGPSGTVGTSGPLFYKTIEIVFPIAFPHACTFCDASIFTGYSISNAYPKYNNSKTNLVISIGNFSSTAANNNVQTRWFALGY